MEEKETVGGALGVGVGEGQAAPREGVELARLQQHHHVARMMGIKMRNHRKRSSGPGQSGECRRV